MLELKNINLTLGKGSKLERKVLNNVSTQIDCNRFVSIIGNNGAGKSSLINVISGFVKADNGSVILDDINLDNLNQQKRSQLIAKVMQDPKIGTMPNMSILENMSFAFLRGQNRGFSFFNSKKRKIFFQEKLGLLEMGLEDRMNDLVLSLSGGQRQALSLIMSLLSKSTLLLLDEITAALDPDVANRIMKLAYKIIRLENKTCIMITHNIDHAIEYSDQIIFMKDGFIKKIYNNKQDFSKPDLLENFNS
jgi:putative ABC transport system ATP-binding protein